MIMRRPLRRLATAGVGFLAVACGGSSPSTSATPVACDTKGALAQATSQSYLFVAELGPVERMFSASDAKGKPAGSGEVMLDGSMTTTDGPNAQHLEVHICQRANNQVILDAHPTMILRDVTAGTPAAGLPVAAMQGVGASKADLHYGNNVVTPAGHSFVLTVKLTGEQVTLDLPGRG